MKIRILVSLLTCFVSCVFFGCGKADNSVPLSDGPKQNAESRTAETASSPTPPAKSSEAAATNKPEPAQDLSKNSIDAAAPPIQKVALKVAEPITAATAEPTASSGQLMSSVENLSQNQMAQGLQEALAKGLQQAITKLGHDGGFLTNAHVRIPMPENLRKVETTLRALKQDKLADDFIVTMNRAAEQAVPAAAGVFADALRSMTIEDARSILIGPKDAATTYFQRTTATNLYASFYPLIKQATEKTGVTAAYKSLLEKANTSQALGSLGKILGGSQFDTRNMDIDAYVTTKAMDGLFRIVAEEEANIRQNPIARTTEVLQKVFGALQK